jgi:hypothetical protein
VARDQANVRWLRFKEACDAAYTRCEPYFAEQDQLRKENLIKKEQLCVQVEELSESTEWNETTDRIKELQAEWKAGGPVPRNKSDAIWQRFRGACDHFFARRASHLDEGRSENLAQKRELCEGLEQALSGEGEPVKPEDLAQMLLKAWDAWKSIGPIPFDEEKPLQDRLNAISAQTVEAHPEAFKDSPLDPEANARRQAELCMQAEVMATTAKEKREGEQIKIEEQDAESMAARLKEALASNTFKEESRAEHTQRAADQVASLRRSWSRVGPVPGDQGRELRERFEKACRDALGT